MTRPRLPVWLHQADRRTVELLRAVGSEIRRIREDAGVSQSALAREARMSPGQLCDIEAGRGDWSPRSLNRIATALGADLSIRLYPNTGPRIRDRFQAPVIEALLRTLHARWRPTLEVAVRHPARGIIDAVLDDRTSPLIVAVESESDVRRVEQHLRWSQDKARSLPSSDLWGYTVAQRGHEPAISRLLVLRATRSNRELVRDLEATFRTAYPADPAAVRRALMTADAPWPGAGMLWAVVEGGSARILDRNPPGLGPRRGGT
ncbi:MAG TPA: helix-turn-helix transcriptional regulator [Clostridia bacterium]|nr:helix-turn-helix transcriptional regulator [Clostridia bacterium]